MSRYQLFLILITTITSSVCFADPRNMVECSNGECVIGDYNIGLGLQVTDKNAAPAVGAAIGANADFVATGKSERPFNVDIPREEIDRAVEKECKGLTNGTDPYYECYEKVRKKLYDGISSLQQDWYIFDSKIATLIGGAGGSNGGFMNLKLIGNVGGGMMMYRILPFTAALEDGEIDVTIGPNQSTPTYVSGLFGWTVYLPLNLINDLAAAGLDQTNLIVSVTYGLRYNSVSPENWSPGIQGKIKWLNNKVSAELRYLYSASNVATENKVVGTFGLNHVFREHDQLGLLAEWWNIQNKSQPVETNQSSYQVFLSYGGDISLWGL